MFLLWITQVKETSKTLLRSCWESGLGWILTFPWTVNSVGVALALVAILVIGILGIKFILGVLFFLIAFIIGYES